MVRTKTSRPDSAIHQQTVYGVALCVTKTLKFIHFISNFSLVIKLIQIVINQLMSHVMKTHLDRVYSQRDGDRLHYDVN